MPQMLSTSFMLMDTTTKAWPWALGVWATGKIGRGLVGGGEAGLPLVPTAKSRLCNLAASRADSPHGGRC